jgi:hypothetical protein
VEREPLPPTDECFEVEDIQGVIAAIKEGRRPIHLDGCPRCRALVESCREFLDPSDVPEGSNLTEASKRLALPALMGWEDRPSAKDASTSKGVGTATTTRRARFPFDLRVLRPVLVGAAIILLVWVAREVGQDEDRSGPSRVLRSDGTLAKARVELQTPSTAASGGIVLRWLPVGDADQYEAIFYREDLSVVRKTNAGQQISLSLSADEVSALSSGGVILWQVVAKKGSLEIARSAPTQLEFAARPGR